MNAPRGPERRRSQRYRVSVPIEFEQGTGRTRDMSESGVLFETDAPMTLGQRLDFAIVFGELDVVGRYRVQCVGEVVRVTPAEHGSAVAVHIQSYFL
jgi:hypothetical protein